jgi:hypothetical protein
MSSDKSLNQPVTSARSRHHSRQWWLDHFKAWQRSGLSKSDYCSANSLKHSSFYNWACKFQQQAAAPRIVTKPSKKGDAFVQALITHEPELPKAQRLTINDVALEFNSGLLPQDLAVWAKALRELPC